MRNGLLDILQGLASEQRARGVGVLAISSSVSHRLRPRIPLPEWGTPLPVLKRLDLGEANVAARVAFSKALEEHLVAGPELVRARLAEVPEGDLTVICRSGGRSQAAAEFLVRQGVPAVNVSGGTIAWALAESHKAPLAKVFCENVLMRLKPENPVLWLTDADGTELANGLALSLRDFGRLGQMLIEARGAGGRSKIPGWFIETLTSSSGMRKAKPSEVEGLLRGSELRYGFVHLGGAANRIALLGPYGNSLYLDFDRRLVIALFASYPMEYSPSLMATLEQLWEAVGAATQPTKKRP